MLRTDPTIATDAVEIYAMGGDGAAINVNKYHNQDPSHKVQSICVIDGDSTQMEDKGNRVFRLPGEAPELIIFNEIIDKIDECSGILTVRCMHQFNEDQVVKNIILDVKHTNFDHHTIFSQIGEKLGFVNESVVRDAFLTTWCEKYPQKVQGFLKDIIEFLPRAYDGGFYHGN